MQNTEAVQKLRSRLGRLQAERRSLIDKHRSAGGTDVLPDETDLEFRGLTADIRELEERIAELAEEDERRARVHAAALTAGVYGPRAQPESRVYSPESRHSFLADMLNASRGTDYEAAARLKEYESEARAMSRADGSGGGWVPPAHLVNEWIGLPRPGRTLADLMERRPTPPETDTVIIPKLVTGSRTEIQPADNDPIVTQDMTETTVSAQIRTIAGEVRLSQQLIDQSAVDMEDVVFSDLAKDHAQRLNLQVLGGTGAAGQLQGLRNVPGITTITVGGTPSAMAVYRAVADATQRANSSLFSPPNVVVMHPRRWAFIQTATDSAGRPLVLPESYNPSNAAGIVAGGAEGRVGTLGGIPVYVDSVIPTNVGVGANEDIVLVLDSRETILFESAVRTRVVPNPASNLTVTCQLWSYCALLPRSPAAITVLTGVQFTPPSFA